jgi:competence CoiA-like predicted nuclease
MSIDNEKRLLELFNAFYEEQGIHNLSEYFIDYSYIIDEEFRNHLESLNRKMIKARIRENFGEYCRFAFIQIEVATEKIIQKYQTDFDKTKKSIYSKYPDGILTKIQFALRQFKKSFDYNNSFSDNLYPTINTLKCLRDELSHGDENFISNKYVDTLLKGRDWLKIKEIVESYSKLILENKV